MGHIMLGTARGRNVFFYFCNHIILDISSKWLPTVNIFGKRYNTEGVLYL